MTAATAPVQLDYAKPLLAPQKTHLLHLDGWRGLSISLVLAAHMLPVGPKSWQGNATAGLAGMAIFFTLSGFLITKTLLEHRSVSSFFIRRLCRILPLAYLYMAVAIVLVLQQPRELLDHALFYVNYRNEPPIPDVTAHLWSLCVEIHFYLFVGLWAGVTRFRGWLLIPVLLAAVMAVRIKQGVDYSIRTHLRVDEILVGSCLALAAAKSGSEAAMKAGAIARDAICRVPLCVYAIFFIATCHPEAGPLLYFRPIGAALLVGRTIFRPANAHRWLLIRPLGYLATVSYAVYVWHMLFIHGWFAEAGSKAELYLFKRPISFVLIFAVAHLSTFYYEKWWIELGKRWTKRKPAAAALPAI